MAQGGRFRYFTAARTFLSAVSHCRYIAVHSTKRGRLVRVPAIEPCSTISSRRNRKSMMMHLDPVLLSRLQWAWVIAWHILLPAFTVGLASYIAVLEGLYYFTGREIWFRISEFWTRIFAVSFGMGVVSGIIMPFQFGTNWSIFRCDRKCPLALAGLRGADGFLP
jgi:bd-type cytochrome oxidase subunit I